MMGRIIVVIALVTISVTVLLAEANHDEHYHQQYPQQYPPGYSPPWAPETPPKKEGLTHKLLGLLGGKHDHPQAVNYLYMSDQDILFSLCRPLGRTICQKVVKIAREKYPTEAAKIVNAVRYKRPEESALSTAGNEFFKKIVKEQMFSRKHKVHAPEDNYNKHQEDANWLHNQEVEARNHYQNAMNDIKNQQHNNPIPTYGGVPIYPSPFPAEHHH